MIFRDRFEAGERLAALLRDYRAAPGLLVLGLPRGGVPVAYEVACALEAPLDVFVVRKLGTPGREELAMGAVAAGAPPYVDRQVVAALDIDSEIIEAEIAREMREVQRRERLYRDHRPRPDPRGRTVILVDDGVATGATLRAGIAALRQQAPAQLVVAVPVAARATAEKLAPLVDDFVVILLPENFIAVGQWYEDFSQTTDDQVRRLLQARYEACRKG